MLQCLPKQISYTLRTHNYKTNLHSYMVSWVKCFPLPHYPISHFLLGASCVHLSEFRRSAECLCSAPALHCLCGGVLCRCCQLPQHFCGFNRPLCRHSASFEVHGVSWHLKNTQDTLLQSSSLSLLGFSVDVALLGPSGLFQYLLTVDRCLAGNHTCVAWSHHTFAT